MQKTRLQKALYRCAVVSMQGKDRRRKLAFGIRQFYNDTFMRSFGIDFEPKGKHAKRIKFAHRKNRKLIQKSFNQNQPHE